MKRGIVTLALLAGAGCIPERDNGYDPANSPFVSFTVSDATLPTGVCADPAIAEEAQEIRAVGAARRGRCLALDARGTIDRNGASDGFEFRFAYVDSSGATSLGEAMSSPIFFLEDDYVRDLTVGTPHRFRVTAIAPGGNVGSEEATLVVLNTPPIADAGPVRTLPLGGHPFALGADFTVRFDASDSTDADGDTDLTYCWVLPNGATPCSDDPADPSFVDTIPSGEERRFVATLSVSDGADESKLASTVVEVRTPPFWRYASTYERMDPGALSFPLPDGGFPDGLTIVGDALLGAYSPVSATSPLRVVAGSLPVPPAMSHYVQTSVANGLRALVPDDTGAVWVVGGAATIDVQRVAVSGTSLTLGAFAALDLGELNVFPSAAAVGGALWVTGGTTVMRVTADGVGTSIASDPDASHRAVVPRPGLDEVWILRMPDATGDGPIVGEPAMLIFDPAGVKLEEISLPPLVYGPMAFMDSSELYLSVIGEGFLVLDPDFFVESRNIDAATIAVLPVAPSARLLVDAASRSILTRAPSADGTAHTVQIRGDRVVELPETFPALLPDVIDTDTGALWFGSETYELIRAFTTSLRTGVAARVVLPTDGIIYESRATSDGAGGVWALASSTFSNSRALAHVASDGLRVDYVSTVQVNGNTEGIPYNIYVRGTPDGDALWGYDRAPGGGPVTLRHYDLTTIPPTLSDVLDDSELAGMLNYVPVLEPSRAGFAWAARISAAPYEVVQVSVEGQLTPRFSIPPAERMPGLPAVAGARGALYRADDSLCLGTVEGTAAIRVRRITPDGTATLLASPAPDPANTLPWQTFRIATSNGPAGNLCWLGTRTSATGFSIFAYSTSGGIAQTVSRTNEILVDMDPVENDLLRIVYYDTIQSRFFLDEVRLPSGPTLTLDWESSGQVVRVHQSY